MSLADSDYLEVAAVELGDVKAEFGTVDGKEEAQLSITRVQVRALPPRRLLMLPIFSVADCGPSLADGFQCCRFSQLQTVGPPCLTACYAANFLHCRLLLGTF